ncbi:MAG: hypothetical protein WC600_02610 [Desulfobaccales bacterium]
MIEIEGWAVQMTEKAVLFVPQSQMDRPCWLPKSQVSVSIGEWSDTLLIPEWLAQNNGLRVLPRAPRRSAR